jgi:hypothetical protein
MQNTETYTYDAYQRLTSIPDRGQSFVYDTCPTNATGCISMAGQLMQATFAGSIGTNQLTFGYNYSYTPAGKVSSKTLELQSANHLNAGGQYANGAVTASYVYDNQGALTSLTYPAGGPPTTLNYTLDAMERPTAMTGSPASRTMQPTRCCSTAPSTGRITACCRSRALPGRT